MKKEKIYIVNQIVFWKYKDSIIQLNQVNSIEYIPGFGIKFIMNNGSYVQWQEFGFETFAEYIKETKEAIKESNSEGLQAVFDSFDIVDNNQAPTKEDIIQPLSSIKTSKKEPIGSLEVTSKSF